MKAPVPRQLDPRQAEDLYRALLARAPAYLPGWRPRQGEPEGALLRILSRYLEATLQRLNQAPDKNRLAFLDLLGVELIPAQAARAPIVLQLAEDAPPQRAAAGTQLAAPPPPEGGDQIVFETEQSVGLTPGRLQQVVSLWPGRDQYIDHSEALAAGAPFSLFAMAQLEDTPHHIYIAHNTLLALAGQAALEVTFELTQTSNEHLNIAWEYWDGKVWRGFADTNPACTGDATDNPDSTRGLQQSGRYLLQSDCAETETTTIDGVDNYWIRGRLREPLPPDPAQILPLVERVQLSTRIEQPLAVNATNTLVGTKQSLQLLGHGLSALVGSATTTIEDVAGLEPELAFANAQQVDTSKAFYPFGQTPQPGDTFYFTSEEIFGKPGAEVTLYVESAATPYDDLVSNCPVGDRLTPEVVWEYWTGRRWQRLTLAGGTDTLAATAALTFTVPRNMRPVIVNDEEALWVRVRLRSGGFGCKQEITVPGDGTFSFVATTPPAVGVFRAGYTWQDGPHPPDHVFSYNDFHYEDNTTAATYSGQTFAPFQLLRDVTPALYLGFDQPLPVDRFNLFFDVVEVAGEVKGPPLQWEYWNGFNWQHLTVADETNDLRVPGMVSLIGPADARALARFDAERHWLRARLKEDGPPGAPTVQTIHPNAVWAQQWRTLVNETLGTSDGRPDQTFTFAQIPVLGDEVVEVKELSGPPANVEWRLLARELLPGGNDAIQEIEEMLRQEGNQPFFVAGDLRLERDRNKRVTGVWVRWRRRDHLFFSNQNDRHYTLERSRGRLRFGDGNNGKAPPPAAEIVARQYRSGGGSAGNVKANTVTQLMAGIGGVEAVFNPRAAEGGADAESLAALAQRGPLTLRHYGRALMPADYEVMAREASPAVAVARALPGRDPGGRALPGWVTLIIIPRSEEPRPWPSYGLREHVRRYISARAPTDVIAAAQLFVTGPDYQEVGVDAVVVPVDLTAAGAVEQAARAALERFFHPLRGGPEGRGWAPGRDVYLSDVAATLERVAGVDYVQELALLADGAPQGNRLRIAAGRVAVAGVFRLRLLAGERQAA